MNNNGREVHSRFPHSSQRTLVVAQNECGTLSAPPVLELVLGPTGFRFDIIEQCSWCSLLQGDWEWVMLRGNCARTGDTRTSRVTIAHDVSPPPLPQARGIPTAVSAPDGIFFDINSLTESAMTPSTTSTTEAAMASLYEQLEMGSRKHSEKPSGPPA